MLKSAYNLVITDFMFGDNSKSASISLRCVGPHAWNIPGGMRVRLLLDSHTLVTVDF
jgi:hypothetical protein